MSNPTLAEGSGDAEWVRYAQELLIRHLADDAAAGHIVLSAVDGDFGPLTAASVRYLQALDGLGGEPGVIGDAEWELLESEPVAVPSPDGEPGNSDPIDLTVPFELVLGWPQLRADMFESTIESVDLESHPGASLTFLEPVSQLFGTGGMQWLQHEFRQNPRVFVEPATRAIIDWGDGPVLGADMTLNTGVEFRDLTLRVQGQVNGRISPFAEGGPTGSFSGSGMLLLDIHIGGAHTDE